MEKVIAEKLSAVVRNVEDQVDEELERLKKMDIDELRQERLAKMKKDAEQRREWKSLGHGQYEEIKDEKEFFSVTKKSQRVVCHFYREETFRCKIVDKHLHILANKHLETKFCKLDAPKAPFLTQRLKIQVLPTMLILKDGIVVDRIIGFTDLGNRDDFNTEVLEWRLGEKEGIDFKGEKPIEKTKRTIRTSNKNGRDEDSDEEDEDRDRGKVDELATMTDSERELNAKIDFTPEEEAELNALLNSRD